MNGKLINLGFSQCSDEYCYRVDQVLVLKAIDLGSDTYECQLFGRNVDYLSYNEIRAIITQVGEIKQFGYDCAVSDFLETELYPEDE